MLIPMLVGFGVAVAGIATVKAASQVPKGPFSKGANVSPYYNEQVQRSLRNSHTFAHFRRRQHLVTQGTPEMVDTTGMTLSQKEAWIRSVERMRAWKQSR